ncbi:hypothetical protein ACLH0B_22515, partial [Aeromonas salmonicida]|uniref:hypothetical protein n=1 Tax=Aeromonas salmonicida TaxID=645 RepID=UPI003D0423E5
MSNQRTMQRHGTVRIGSFELLIRLSRIDHQTPNPLNLFDVLSFELASLGGSQPGIQAQQGHPPVLNS